jgi:hypothetical protein
MGDTRMAVAVEEGRNGQDIGHVYFITEKDDEEYYFKLGKTKSEHYLKPLQTGNPRQLKGYKVPVTNMTKCLEQLQQHLTQWAIKDNAYLWYKAKELNEASSTFDHISSRFFCKDGVAGKDHGPGRGSPHEIGPQNVEGYVFFVREDGDKYFMVGLSRHPENYLQGLQKGNPRRLHQEIRSVRDMKQCRRNLLERMGEEGYERIRRENEEPGHVRESNQQTNWFKVGNGDDLKRAREIFHDEQTQVV